MKELKFAVILPVLASSSASSAIEDEGVGLPPLLEGVGLPPLLAGDGLTPLLAGDGLPPLPAGDGEDGALYISTVKLFAAIVFC